MIRKEIEKLIEKSVKELQKKKTFPVFALPDIKIDNPENKTNGDYSTNIAMQISKFVKKKPIEIAKLIIKNYKWQIGGLFERIESSLPGFINFFIKKEFLQKKVEEILTKGEKFGDLDIGDNKKVQVEFISANPTGPLTVGNARGGPFGDVLANVLKKSGFKVEKAYYINDYGMQILTLGHSVLKDSEAKYKGDYIDYLNPKIKEQDPYKAGEQAAKIIVEEMIKKSTDKMGIKYDEWISETDFHKSHAVDKVLESLKKKDLIYEKEGAFWFKSSKFGDQRDRVIVKKDGWKTYLAGDSALHQYKFENKKFDRVINIWGADHAGDVAGLQAIIEALGHKGKLDIVLLQFVTLFEKQEKLKMSKRLGIYVTMDELLDKVGVDAARFFFLQKSADTHLNFDLALAKEQSAKNPVYYVQYAHARICSILEKARISKYNIPDSGFQLLNHSSELELIKQLVRFLEVIEDTARDYQIQRIPQYALDLATVFHQFYRDCQVLTENGSFSEARLGLILATQVVLKNTLNLMGISVPEKMYNPHTK
jgi:arginyl-tRNA synthetase